MQDDALGARPLQPDEGGVGTGGGAGDGRPTVDLLRLCRASEERGTQLCVCVCVCVEGGGGGGYICSLLCMTELQVSTQLGLAGKKHTATLTHVQKVNACKVK